MFHVKHSASSGDIIDILSVEQGFLLKYNSLSCIDYICKGGGFKATWQVLKNTSEHF